MDGFSLQYTDHAQNQLGALPFEVMSRVESTLERICREHDPMRMGSPVYDIQSRRRYRIDPVQVIAWITCIEPLVHVFTVVEIVFPDQVVPLQPPHPTLPDTRRIMDPRGRQLVPAGI